MSKQKRRQSRTGIKSYASPTPPVSVDNDFDEEELDEGAFRVLGRVTRAVTYSVLSNDYADMTMRELYALTSLAHAEYVDCSYCDPEGNPVEMFDTADIFIMMPGVSQGFFQYSEILSTLESLEQRGLVELERHDVAPRMERMLGRDYSVRASLTTEGLRLVHSMCGNLNKAASMFDEDVVRQGLDQYHPL
ncbi:hypothetical protein GPA27_16390 [Aromatoleum toluolicum]|uniref:Uncharacterized protein n=1 Tax=Aromatoleum toluolicum TaxID=90060 RepID=A0ABX1NI98_9RHOO|nr:hypothetical protein [Aromatoleum toluolicum]NMF98959.1 hypothetical protein [Aromatoleum toluolicum]